MTGQCRRLIIVDPSLRDTRGHHYALTSVIAESAINSGVDVVILANRSVDSLLKIDNTVIIPTFGMTTYDHFKVMGKNKTILLRGRLRSKLLSRIPSSILSYMQKVKRNRLLFLARKNGNVSPPPDIRNTDLSDELLDALLKENVSHLDHVLVHTADAMVYRALLKLFQKKYPSGKHPCFHLCTPYDMRIMPHSAKGMPVTRVINYLDLMGVINRSVFLYGENELLAKSLASTWGVDVSVLDIPMKKRELKQSCKIDVETIFRVVYLGAAREEKGFNLLPDVIDRVTRQMANGYKIKFIIQCSPQIVGYTSAIEASISKLKKFSSSTVKLITKQQSMYDYYSLLDQSDLVLLCYQMENYAVRGSGIATEAIAYGKNVIATPETYPSWLAGEAGISATSSNEIADAIMTVAKNREWYLDKAKQRAEWFFTKTRPEAYVSKLLAKASSGRDSGPISKISGSESISRLIKVESGDNECSESRCDSEIREAVVSEDGCPLFVQ